MTATIDDVCIESTDAEPVVDDRRATRRLRVAVVVAALLTMFVASFGVGARSTYGALTSSDEPQYLLTALSLAEDFDLDISDEIERRAFEPFHEISLNTQTFPLNESGQRLSPHDPLLPLVAAPAMRIGGWLGVRILLVTIGGLTAALATWTAVRRFGVRPSSALVGVGSMMIGAPIAAYSTQVFPEILAALLVTVIAAAGTGPELQRRHAGWVVTATVALPWTSIKYAGTAAVAVLVLGLMWWRRGERRMVVLSTIALAVSGVVYLAVHQRIYGGWTVYSTGDHFIDDGEFAVVGTNPDYWGRSRRIIGLLADRRYGLVPWAPVWIFAPAALAWLAARRHRLAMFAIATIAAGWATATFVALTMHGWWSPGRQIVVVAPLIALALSVLVDEVPRLRWPVGVLGLAGASTWVWLAIEASTDRRVLIVDFYETAAPVYRLLSPVFAQGWPRTGAAGQVL
ncbi:MAG: hypothetical protein AAFP84_19390, partial [Actinomycetota bacterium]